MEKFRNTNSFILEYKIGTGRLGTSSHEEIKKALHLRTKQARTVKMIFKKSCSRQQILQIKKEILLLGELDHPNILKMYEYFEDRRFFYIVFEDIQQGSLFDFIRSNDFLSQERAGEIFYNLLEALSYLHARKILHKSINPFNVLLSDDKIKLSNFSTAIVEPFDEDFPQVLENNAKYVAPEMLNLITCEKSDLWSAGLVYFFILTKKHLFDFVSAEENHFSILYDEINFQSYEFRKKMSQSARCLLYSILHKFPP